MTFQKMTALLITIACVLFFRAPDGIALTIGSDLNFLPTVGSVDSFAGIIIAITDDPFTEVGTLTDWSFYAKNTGMTDLYVTPLILSEEGNSFSIAGIGSTVIVSSGTNGVLADDFGLTSGSDYVDPGDVFGWWYGNVANNMISKGSVVFTNNPSGGGVIYSSTYNSISTDLTFTPQTKFTINGELSRNYYFSATDTERPAPVPEPNTLILLGIGLLGAGVVRRKIRAS